MTTGHAIGIRLRTPSLQEETEIVLERAHTREGVHIVQIMYEIEHSQAVLLLHYLMGI